LKLRTASGNLKAQALGSSSIARYIAARRREDPTPANATINRALAYVRRATKLGAQQDPPLVLRVPHFEMLPVAEPRQGVVTHEDYRASGICLPATRASRFQTARSWFNATENRSRTSKRSGQRRALRPKCQQPYSTISGRTALANMIEAGLSEKEAMEISGHRTRAVFDRYHIVSERRLREMAGKLELHLNSKETSKAEKGAVH
jgi:hypothetical protein